jgi:hypothetical protein
MAKKLYSVRKAGTRNGMPHYSSECNACTPPRVLAIGHLSKAAATDRAVTHLANVHAIRL